MDNGTNKKPTAVSSQITLSSNDTEGEKTEREMQPDVLCPQCRSGKLEYDSMLNITCSKCGFTIGGCFT